MSAKIAPTGLLNATASGLAMLCVGCISDRALSGDLQSRRDEPTNVCEREIISASRENGVPVAVLYAVALTETGQKGSLSEYAMNVGGRPVFNRSLEDALKIYAKARRDGVLLIDVGCMQINFHYHGKSFHSIEEMFDPRRNVRYAADFLRRLHASEGAWTNAVARYHAGPSNFPAQKSYVCAVIERMVSSGFGARTPQSRAFCGN